MSDATKPPLDAYDRLFAPSIVSVLQNIGNTCFANSALQCIANLPAIVCALRFVCRFGAPGMQELGLDPGRPLPPSRGAAAAAEADVVRSAVRTLATMETNDQLHIAPRDLIRAVAEVNETFADFGSQQDAAEWLLHGVVDACSDYVCDRSLRAAHISQALADVAAAPPQKGAGAGAATKSGARFIAGVSWSSHAKHSVWRTIAQADDANARAEYDEKVQKRDAAIKKAQQNVEMLPPFAAWKAQRWDDAYSPYLRQSAATDALRGTMLTEVRCHTCSYTSRTFNEFTSLELAFPSAAERAAYRDMVAERKHSAAASAAATNNSSSRNAAAANASSGFSPSNGAAAAATDTASDKTISSDAGPAGSGECGVTASSSIFLKILFLPCAIISSVCKAIARCFSSLCASLFMAEPEGPVSLDELLWVHCRGRQLLGDNQYACPRCACKCNAALSMRVLELPQVLALHLKRFERASFGGMWTEKIPDFVEFPGAVDPTPAPPAGWAQRGARPQLAPANLHLEAHREIAADAGSPLAGNATQDKKTNGGGGGGGAVAGRGIVLDLSPFSVSKTDAAADGSAAADSAASSSWVVPEISTYSLNSVINHHGGFAGGHYTAFVRKPADDGCAKARWALMNDDRASVVGAEDVVASQAYVLLYEKTPLCAERPELTALRRLAREYLVGRRSVRVTSPPADVADAVAVPRLWLLRVALFAEPGPLLHRAVSPAQAQRRAADPGYALLTSADFDTLVETFGELRLPRVE